MVELSTSFMRLASEKDTDRVFYMLPYKTLSFSKVGDRHGIYALIGRDESRDKEIRKPRSSIRAQLARDAKKTARKRRLQNQKITNWRYEHEHTDR